MGPCRVAGETVYCRNAKCARRTFAEPLPELVAPQARRTTRLAEAQGQVGAALGGEAAAGRLHRLAMPASPDMVLRLVHGLPLPAPEPPRVVAVDDWAIRKGRTYGPIVVDLERQRAIGLLPDRTSTTVADWLQQRPGIEVVARDRSTEYARAASIGAPKAVQIADRWHLLSHVRDMLERWLVRAYARLRCLPVPPGDNGRYPGQRTRAFRPSRTEVAAGVDGRARWLAAYEDVRRRYLAGEALLAIGRATGLARATVRKYALRQELPRAGRAPAGAQHPRPVHRPPGDASGRRLRGRHGALARGAGPWLRARSQGGAEVGGREQDEASPEDAPQMAARRTGQRSAWHRIRPWPGTALTKAACRDGLAVLASGGSLRDGCWCARTRRCLSPLDAATVKRTEQDAKATQVASLARRFTALVRGCGAGQPTRPTAPVADLDAWLAEARASGIGAVETFAAGLEQDGAAVCAALTEPWSSGQAEGQINRLKFLKRQGYGRAGFDLLRRRVLIAV